jgi:hypothetical protein
MTTIIAKKTIIALLRDATNYFKNNSVVMQFIPILLVFFYATYRHAFIQVSNSILGKLFAVMLILYYTRMDYLFGVICCIVVIWYYQQTEVEGMQDEEKKAEEKKEEEKKEEEKKPDEVEDGTNLPPIDDTSREEGFSILNINDYNKAKDEFIREKCKNGVLMYKDFPVKSEMADHVYSEIKFNGRDKCNPCDRTCDYNIVEAKLETERKLIPKTSNDTFESVKHFFGLSESFEPNCESRRYTSA